MSINQDPDFYKILIAIIAGMFGILDFLGMKILSELKDTDKEIFNRVNDHEKRLSTLEGEHKERRKK